MFVINSCTLERDSKLHAYKTDGHFQVNGWAPLKMIRRFHTFPVPINTPRLTLKDGSVLILKESIQEPDRKSLPPPLFKRKEFPPLDQDKISQIMSLRSSTPDLWTVKRLAKKFNTHETRIMSIVQCPPERLSRLQSEIDEEFNALSPHKKRVIIDRMRRRALW